MHRIYFNPDRGRQSANQRWVYHVTGSKDLHLDPVMVQISHLWENSTLFGYFASPTLMLTICSLSAVMGTAQTWEICYCRGGSLLRLYRWLGPSSEALYCVKHFIAVKHLITVKCFIAVKHFMAGKGFIVVKDFSLCTSYLNAWCWLTVSQRLNNNFKFGLCYDIIRNMAIFYCQNLQNTVCHSGTYNPLFCP